MVVGNINSDELPAGPIATVYGDNISISIENMLSLTNMQDRTSQVTSTDIQGTNGVSHGINTVVLPNL